MKLTLLAALAVLWWPAQAAAGQSFDSVGARALGMGGAFVGVANDASAVLWNPAGLVSGSLFGATIEWDRLQIGNGADAPAAGAIRRSSKFASLGTWPLGLSYGSFRTSSIVTGAAGDLSAQSLSTSYVGVTVLQTLLEGIVGGTTLKYVRGTAVSGAIDALTTDDALDRAGTLEGEGRGTFDLDVGLMFDLRRVRVGWTTRNLRSPSFKTTSGIEMTLKRQSRVGLAVLPTDGLTLAMDVDLDTADQSAGLRRLIALGGEVRLGPRAAARAGVHWSLEGARMPATSAGASVAVRPGFWLDGFYSYGRAGEDRGFGIALRAGR